jgi:hypothetical protein
VSAPPHDLWEGTGRNYHRYETLDFPIRRASGSCNPSYEPYTTRETDAEWWKAVWAQIKAPKPQKGRK